MKSRRINARDISENVPSTPTSERVILGNNHAIQLANSLKKYERCGGVGPGVLQQISYDTTFQITDAYCSAIVMRNVFLEGEPVLPVIFCLHGTKDEAVHKDVWRSAKDLLYLKPLTGAVPEAKVVLCHNHLAENISEWVKKHGRGKDDVSVYKDHLYTLLDSNTKIQQKETYNELSEVWSKTYKEYFDTRIRPELNRASKYYYDQFPVRDNDGSV